jgi:O-antigen/teichoic acid export membrane protein
VKLLALARNPSLRSAIAFALGGVAFAGGNLLLARVMSARDYGTFALVVAIVQVVMVIGPCGADIVVNRHLLPATSALLARVLATSSLVALAAVALSSALYGLDPLLLVLLFAGGVCGAANWVASACFQCEQRFAASLALNQGANAVILFSVVPAWLLAGDAQIETEIVCAGYLLMAAAGWSVLLGESRARPAGAEPRAIPWREGVAAVGIQGAGLVMVQGERLVTPVALGVEDLAAFAVLAALIASPFRVLQEGLPHALLPRLRAAESPRARLRLLLRQCALGALGCAAIAAGVSVLTPYIERFALAGKYELGGALLAVTLAVGVAKVAGALAATIVNALGSPSDLRSLSRWSWVSAGVSIAMGYAAGPAGLTGVVAGVGAGWYLRAIAATALARRHFVEARADLGMATELR